MRDRLDTTERERDAQRNGLAGTGRTDMTFGGGDLFAGSRPDQMALPQSRSSGLNVEVAPDPRTEGLKQAFGKLAESRRAEISRLLGGKHVPRILDAMGVRGFEVEHTVGGVAGDTNPSIIVRLPADVDFDGMVEAGKVIGTVFSQQAVIA